MRLFRRAGLQLSAAVLLLGAGAASASAAVPTVGDTWVTGVTASVGVFHSEVNPNGLKTTYHYDFISDSAYQANLAAAKDPFSGASTAPVGGEANIGVSSSFEEALQHVGGMKADTVYRFRLAATNISGTSYGATEQLLTQSTVTVFALPEDRGWEMVSPPDKNGGEVQSFNGVFGGGVLQGSGAGGAVTYSSTSSFAGASGAPGASQYLARRTSTGWVNQNITLPMVAGGYSTEGTPYQLFTDDLLNGLVINGDHCRTTGTDCPVANPPLPGSGAPAGYRNYYVRDSQTGASHALLTASEVGFTDVGPENFDITFVGASPGFGNAALSSCAALTSNAKEVLVGGDDCDAAKQNVYLWSLAGPRAINVLPGDTQSTPGAELGAQSNAISADGTTAYWTATATGNLYVNEAGAGSTLVSAGGAFQTASTDGGVAFFTQGGHLYRYTAPSGPATDLTPGGGVLGVLGASADGAVVYYLDGTGVHRWDGATSQVSDGANASNYPPTTGTARVSADGSRLLFLSDESPTDFNSFGTTQVYLYSEPGTGGSTGLACVSCNPAGERPEGGSSIPGAIANGEWEGATQLYKPMVLTANGNQVFFDSADALLPKDTNGEPDVYEWQAAGVAGCTRPAGCIQPISSGRSAAGASFVDASADGRDAYFLTDESMVARDPGGVDLYDARVGGGFPEPIPPLACVGDACQGIPPKPEDPSPGTGFLTDELNGPVKITNIRHKHRRKHHGKKHHKKHQGGGKKKGGRR
jgi:hypothetical protein